MIKSMTGFGASLFENEFYNISIDLKAVNHRFCDINIKTLKEVLPFEINIRKIIKDKLKRGKIDLYIDIKFKTKSDENIFFDFELAKVYIDYMKQLSIKEDINTGIDAYKISSMTGVLSNLEVKLDDEFEKILYKLLNEAIDKLNISREIEGENLKNDLSIKIETLEVLVNNILDIEPNFLDDYKNNLKNRINEQLIDSDVSEDRVLTEVAILTDKICIDEELVRLKSHISQIKSILLCMDEEKGRKLDFIVQELNREANTILSKSNCLDVVNYGIELKSTIEKIREQVQNLL